MSSRAFLALTFLALGCNNGGSTDGGTDAGTDGGSDGGLDAGLCSRGVWTDGSGDGYRAPSASVDGVLGYRSHVSQWALIEYNTAMPLPTECIDVTVKDPDGAALQSTVARQSAVVDVSFMPSKLGVHHVTMAIDGGPVFQNDVAVYPDDAPDLTLAGSCSSLVFASGVLGCDGQLLDTNGTQLTAINGRWLAAGNELLAWTDGGLSFASLDDAGVAFGAAVAAPFPESWSSFGAVLAIGTNDGGVVFSRDGGSLAAVASLPAGYVDVFSDGTAVSMTVNQFDSPVGLVYSAGSDHIVSWVGLNTINGGSLQCFVPDAGGVSLQQPACDPYFSPRLFHLEANDWRPPRRTLAQTEHGVRLPDGGAMFLADAGQISAEEHLVWQSSANQTAVWFR